MTTQALQADERSTTGRKVKKLRTEGIIPANVFGKDVKSYAISVSADEFRKVFSEAGETGVIELTVGKKKNPVLVSNVQTHPVTGDILHIDFRQVDLSKKITATVPIEIVGEAPAEKSGLGTLVQHLSELEVEALPTDLPESFEVDVAGLVEVDSSITVKDLKYDRAKITITSDEEQIIAKVEPPQEEKVEEAVAETEDTEETPTEEQKEEATENQE